MKSSMLTLSPWLAPDALLTGPRHRRLVAWKMAVTSYFIEAAAGPIFTPAENVE